MRCISFLLLLTLCSCNDFNGFRVGSVKEIEYGDTIKVVTHEVRYETVFDTVYTYINVESQLGGGQAVVDTLKRYIGLTEATGNNDGYHIQKFTRVSCDAEKVMWCAGFIGYGLTVNGYDIPELGCWAAAYFPDDRVTWRQGTENHNFKAGDMFGVYFASKNRVAHCGTILEDYGDWILTLEGNTNDAGSRDGNGAFVRLRHISQIYVVSDWIQEPQYKHPSSS